MAENIEVRCPKCGTAHRFEKARLPAAGLRVNCHQCTQPFTVSRDRPVEEPGWMLRKADGEVRHFDDLGVLKGWITEQTVQRDDEISRTGRQWKPLGTIEELAPFFKSAAPTDVAADPQHTAVANKDAFETLPAAFPGAGPQQAGDVGAAVDRPPEPTDWNLSDLEPPTSAAFVVPEDSIVRDSPTIQVKLPPPAAPPRAKVQPPAVSPRALQDSVYIAPRTAPHRAHRGMVLASLVLLFAATLVVAFVERRSWFDFLFPEPVPTEAIASVQQGEELLRRDSNSAIAQALTRFEAAAASAPHYGAAQAWIATAELAHAEWAVLESDELDRNRTEATALQTAALRNDAAARAERARAAAQQAQALDPEALASVRAAADVARYLQDGALLRPLLDRLRQLGPTDPDVLYVLGSEAVQRGDALSAQQHFERALQVGSDRQRTRFKLALLHAEAGRPQEALPLLATLLAAVPDHERALALQQRLQVVPETPPPPTVVETAVEKPTGERLSFHQLLAKADRLRRRDQTRAALGLFEKALDMEPEDPDALTGMGWCYLDLDRADAAIGVFAKIAQRLPRYSDAQLGLAEAYRAKGMNDDAIKHYELYLDIMPNGPEASIARRVLEKLKSGG